ncbi:MAG: hypothetical protein NUW22_15090 [Acidobacteria bacterium]|nr:hypothetical protein [Acidobacteriota bacterium]
MRISRSLLQAVLAAACLAAVAVTVPLAAQFGGAAAPTPALRAATGDAVTDALRDLSWRSIGPANMGGRVSAILGVPGDPKTFWVGGVDGGVWKTTDAGTTFQGVFEEEFAYSVGSLTLAPSDHNVVWLGSGEGDPRNSVGYGNGVYRSTDAGRTWTHLGLSDSERIKRIVVHPKNPDVALVCALGHEWGDNEERGVFKTTDGGRTWTKVLYINPETGCSDLDMDLTNPRNVYAGMWTFRRTPWRFDDGGKETALYVSRDLGDTWKKITTTPTQPMARPGVSVAQGNPSVVYLVTEYPTAGTLFRSNDYGETWTMVNDDRNLNFRPFYYSDVIADPNDENTVFVISGGQSKSTDGGRTFVRTAAGVHGDHQALWIDPQDSNRILNGSDGGYQVSYDGGFNYHIFRNVVLSQFYQIFYDDRDPYFVCGGLQDNGNWCGPSRSKAGAILTDDWFTVSGGDGFYAVPVPGKPHIVYSNSQGGYFTVTDTNTGRARSIPPYPRMIGSAGQGMFRAKYRFNWNAPIHISPHDVNVTYWGGNVLFRSRDEFYTFDVISPDLTNAEPHKLLDSGGEIYNDNTAAEFHATILTVAESPREKGVIWVGTDDGNVQVTRNDGGAWTKVNARIPGFPAESWVGKIDASHHVNGRAYITVDQHRLNDFTPHVFRCDDYGQKCENLSAGLPKDDYAIVVREDPKNPDVLYAGMERGLQVSLDAGRTWHDFRLNLPRVSVRDIKVHPRENDLIIGTHGRGAWILDDIAPVQNLAAAMAADVTLFDVHRATRWERWDKDSNLGASTWLGENPPAGAMINYFLKADAPATGAGAVTITIADANGAVVNRIQDRGMAGVNRVVWDLSWANPAGMPAGGGRGGGRGGGARLPAMPGKYTATIVAAGRTMSKTFELRGDPDVNLSAAEYQAQFDAATRARDLMVRASRLVTTVDDLTQQVTAAEAQARKGGMVNIDQVLEQAGSAKAQLTALMDKLRRPQPAMNYRMYPRLMEEVGTTLGGIVGPQAKPTAGLLTVLAELEGDAAARQQELTRIIDGSVAALNKMLGGQPKIVVPRQGGGR